MAEPRPLTAYSSASGSAPLISILIKFVAKDGKTSSIVTRWMVDQHSRRAGCLFRGRRLYGHVGCYSGKHSHGICSYPKYE
jgi:hypothetical protein